MWFNYSKKTNFFCISTFIMALLNLIIQFIWLAGSFSAANERFQGPGFNYGDVAYYNSIMMILICVTVILGANDMAKYIKIAKYLIVFSQFLQVILEIFICYNSGWSNITLFFIIQPVPFLLFMILYMVKKVSLKVVVFFCVFDYFLFIGKEFILYANDFLGFYIVFQRVGVSVIKLFFCILLVLILLCTRCFIERVTG